MLEFKFNQVSKRGTWKIHCYKYIESMQKLEVQVSRWITPLSVVHGKPAPNFIYSYWSKIRDQLFDNKS